MPEDHTREHIKFITSLRFKKPSICQNYIYEQSAKEQAAQAETKNDSKVVDAEVVDEKK